MESFVSHAVRWLPKESYIGNVSYLVSGQPSVGSDRIEKIITDALRSLFFNVMELRRVRVFFDEQLEDLKVLSNGAKEHTVVLHFYVMPDLSRSRYDSSVTTQPLAFTLRHWIPEGDDRLPFLSKELLVEVPRDFDYWQTELKRIVPY